METVSLRPKFGSETKTLRWPNTCNTELHNKPIIPAPITSMFEPMSIDGNLSNACTMHDKGSHNTAVKHYQYLVINFYIHFLIEREEKAKFFAVQEGKTVIL